MFYDVQNISVLSQIYLYYNFFFNLFGIPAMKDEICSDTSESFFNKNTKYLEFCFLCFQFNSQWQVYLLQQINWNYN